MHSSKCQIARNARFLLWQRGVPRDEWATWLKRRTGWPPSLVERLIHDDLDDSRLGADEVAELLIGNAAGLDVIWNGRDLGQLGRTGQVRRLYFLPTEFGIGSPPVTSGL